MATRDASQPIGKVGRYTIFPAIAAGGMGTVHPARFAGPDGFSRVVAMKRLHPHLVDDAELKAMFISEAQLVAHIHHPNVVAVLDVLLSPPDLFMVMEYVRGETLSVVRKLAEQQGQEIPLSICSAIMVGALNGLHAAHEARTELEQPLHIIHRDLSPPNILIGVDGIPVVVDFGVAKAMEARQGVVTRPGVLKGRASYMAPERIRGEAVTRAVDIFSAAVIFWELLTTRRLFAAATDQERMHKVLQGADATPPSAFNPRVGAALDQVVLKGLRPDPGDRYATALEMAEAIEALVPPASPRAVGEWVARTAARSLGRRAAILKQVEMTDSSISDSPARPDAAAPPAPPAVFAAGGAAATGLQAAAGVPGKAAGAGSPRDRRTVLGAGAGAAALMVLGIALGGSAHATRAVRPSPLPAPAVAPATPAPRAAAISGSAPGSGARATAAPLGRVALNKLSRRLF